MKGGYAQVLNVTSPERVKSVVRTAKVFATFKTFCRSDLIIHLPNADQLHSLYLNDEFYDSVKQNAEGVLRSLLYLMPKPTRLSIGMEDL